MNAIFLEPVRETSLPGVSTSSPESNADKPVGWASEARRLALSANRPTRAMTTSAHDPADTSMNAPPCSHTTQRNTVIVDRWLTNFWGEIYDPAIVDELAARQIFLSHSMHAPRVGREPLKTLMTELRNAFPISGSKEQAVSLRKMT
jgi:hypothetical protein